jgi:hypothetical protein
VLSLCSVADVTLSAEKTISNQIYLVVIFLVFLYFNSFILKAEKRASVWRVVCLPIVLLIVWNSFCG